MAALRIFKALLIVGLGMAGWATIAVLMRSDSGGFKYFGFVLAGLASATIGAIGVLSSFPRKE